MSRTTSLLILISMLAGCGQPNTYQPPPAIKVTVAQPIKKKVINYLEETGTTEPVEMVEIRARVKGFLEEIKFQPGDNVKAGDVLYLIQPGEYDAKVKAAQAALQLRKVQETKTKLDLARAENLYKKEAITEAQLQEQQALHDGSIAAVMEAEAQLLQAELDLKYTKVVSPISGRAGKTLVKQGNLVGDGLATHLTTVISYDPIYANFNISEQDYLEIQEKHMRSSDDAERREKRDEIVIGLRRANDPSFKFEGKINYADLAVDQSTGTYAVRGIFPNPNKEILPGLFVRIRVPLGEPEESLLIPERALGADQTGRFVLTVNSDGVVERHNVEVGIKTDGLIVIKAGLQGYEWIITDGIQRTRPGAQVEAVKSELTAQTPAKINSTRSGGTSPPDSDTPRETETDNENDSPQIPESDQQSEAGENEHPLKIAAT